MAKKDVIIDTFTPVIEKMLRESPDDIKGAMEKIAMAATAKAQENIPARLRANFSKGAAGAGATGGVARGSVGYEDRSTSNNIKFVVGTAMDYPRHLEFGTRRGIEVGKPASPLKTWAAKRKRGGGPDIMPWLRPAIRSVRKMFDMVLRSVFPGEKPGTIFKETRFRK